MAIVIKPIAEIASKWAQRAQAASGDYTKGVESTQKDWSQLTANASNAWQTGVTQAASRGSFTKGVRAAGTSKWRDAAKTKGAQRYGPGVSVAEPDFQNGFAPYAQTIASLSLPQRQAKGSPANYDRVRAIGTALHAKKVGV